MKNLPLYFCFFLLFGQTKGLAQCNPDLTAPVAVCVVDLSRDVAPPPGSITVNAADFNAGSYDACDPSNTLGYFIELAPQSPSHPSTTSLNFTAADAGDHSIVLWVVDAAGNAATCQATLHINACQSTTVLACNDQVVVTLGINNTYELNAFDMLEGGPYCDYNTYQVRLDQLGTPQNSILLGPDDIGVHFMTVSGTGAVCWGNLIVEPGTLNSECPQLLVDLSTIAIRPCFNGNYSVYYANASAIPVDDTYIDVTLDDDLEFLDSSIPAADLGNNVYRFETGDLGAGESGLFHVYFHTDCDAVNGATHCSEAHIYPDTVCAGGQAWSGAEISVEGSCANDMIQLSIKNIGSAATTQPLGYVVVEDVLMLTEGSFGLGSGETYQLPPIAANGATFRLEAEQEPGYPYGGMPSVSIEGCGGFNPGMVTLFSTENANPSISVNCRENTSSYDPNDKQAFPKGYGAEHFIEKNTPIDYMIRFQNTGTDTAFNVVLVDTLSGFLDPQSIRAGASSHPYKFDLLDGHILRIAFDQILLPHKAVDEDGSQGFAQFSIKQQPDLPDGARIENAAAIYFDFNAPVITNQTFLTVGSKFVAVVSTDETPAGLAELKVYPNPASDLLFFDSKDPVRETMSFTLTDARGRCVQQSGDVVFPMNLKTASLGTGVYFFRFSAADGRPMWSGKVLVK